MKRREQQMSASTVPAVPESQGEMVHGGARHVAIDSSVADPKRTREPVVRVGGT